MARLFVSDVHLDAGAPQAIEQFLDFLKLHAHGAEALYILGDLFETWVGDDDSDLEKARITSALRELTASGVATFVIHGNRDFLLGQAFCARTGCELLTDPTVVELDGERVLMSEVAELTVGSPCLHAGATRADCPHGESIPRGDGKSIRWRSDAGRRR